MKRKTRKKFKKGKKLTTKDYIKIIKFYKKAPSKIINPKQKAIRILTDKFCSCIKKVKEKGNSESNAIGICTKSVLGKKKLKRGRFSCKKRKSLHIYKGGRKYKKRKRTRKNK